jgi:HEXXH motif-containing protein
MIMRFVVPGAALDGFAAGEPDPDALSLLRRAALSRALLLVRCVLDHTADGRAAYIDEAVSRLGDLRRSHPTVVDEVLTEPHLIRWAAENLRPGASADDVGHLAAIAATAAVRVGAPTAVHVPVVAGRVVLPGLGTARLDSAGGPATVRVLGPGRAQITAGASSVGIGSGAPGWTPVRELTATASGLTLRLRLDDQHPYRRYAGLTLTGPLDDAAAFAWTDLLQRAWTLLVAANPHTARAVIGGLISLVPIVGEPGTHHAATAPDAVGAVALSHPPDAATLAVSLVHELQHTILAGLLDLVRLHRADATPRYYAPWRDDARPFEALLHGAYAFQGVARFWRDARRAGLPGVATDEAEYQFALWRGRVVAATATLARSGLLTSAGERFVAGMCGAQRDWPGERLGARARTRAARAAVAHWNRWRVRYSATPMNSAWTDVHALAQWPRTDHVDMATDPGPATNVAVTTSTDERERIRS